jgi:hypothetical protein
MKGYSLYYWDRRLEAAEVMELLKLAWEELCLKMQDSALRSE